MKTVHLTIEVLRNLYHQGYTVLESNMPLASDNPEWTPQKVEDIWKYLDGLTVTPFQESNVLVIEDALRNPESCIGHIKESYLKE